MVLNPNEIPELIRSPKSKKALGEALYQEERLKFHGEPRITNDALYNGNTAQTDFMARVNELLTARKYKRFEQLSTNPVKTNEFFEGTFSEFHKVFQANNSFIKCEFNDDETEEGFRPIEQDIAEWFRVQGFRNSQTRINGAIVVDVPAEGGDPYFYFLDVKRIVDVKNTEDGNAEYLIFLIDKDLYAVLDDEFYRVVKVTGDTSEILREQPHGLGWTPARLFWTDDLNHNNHVVKKSPFSSSLSRLDDLLFKMISREYATLYASYPILTAYKPKCDYSDDFGNECHNGKVTLHQWHEGSKMAGETIDCPSCSGKDMIGPGSIYWIDSPADKEDPDNIDSVKVIPADVKSLEYISTDIKHLEDQIFFDVVGNGREPKNDQAKNEKQIVSSFESRQNALMRYKRNMELIHEFVLKTCATLKYGDAFVGCVVDYGDQFFLATESELKEQYKLTKEIGMPDFELLNIIEQTIGTKYKNSPDQRNKANILMELDPFPTRSTLEVSEEDGLDPMDVIIKKNFIQFLNRFERENGSIVRFGSEIPFETKINRVRESLERYALEKFPEAFSNEVEDSGGDDNEEVEVEEA